MVIWRPRPRPRPPRPRPGGEGHCVRIRAHGSTKYRTQTLQRQRFKNVSFPRRWMTNTLHHLHPSKRHTRMMQYKTISAPPLPLSYNIEASQQCECAWIVNLSKSTYIPTPARTSPRIPINIIFERGVGGRRSGGVDVRCKLYTRSRNSSKWCKVLVIHRPAC